jgi:hypothetical protein
MALGSTQSLTEMSTEVSPGVGEVGKEGRSLGLTIPHLLADCLEIVGASTPGALGRVLTCDGIVL